MDNDLITFPQEGGISKLGHGWEVTPQRKTYMEEVIHDFSLTMLVSL